MIEMMFQLCKYHTKYRREIGRNTVPHFLQLAIAEHVLLMGVGGVFCSALLSPLLLALSQQGRRFMSKAATWCGSQG